MDKFTYKYLFVEHKIRRSIRHLKVDTKLNGERIIAKELGISYMTVRKAVELLVIEGVLYKIPKRGTYVAERVQ
jgi:DNA-binding GntR family transcriptional regulator